MNAVLRVHLPPQSCQFGRSKKVGVNVFCLNLKNKRIGLAFYANIEMNGILEFHLVNIQSAVRPFAVICIDISNNFAF